MRGKLFSKICDIRTLWHAWGRVKRKGASGGIDGITIELFEKDLDRNLKEVSELLETGRYIPEPTKRVPIPKIGKPGEKRFIALPVVKDKIVQEAVRSTIEFLFESRFLDCSYGYRPGMGPQKAIEKLTQLLHSGKTWVVKCDIDNFFDSVDRRLLMSFVSKIIWEKEIVRLIELWLKMGVIDRGRWVDVNKGIPQGNVISPLLSNIYLHQFDVEMKQEKGYNLVRYADDFVVLCRSREEGFKALDCARAFLEKELLLKLNPEPNPVKNPQTGFVFLGFLFKGSRKVISADKLEKIKGKIKEIMREGFSGTPFQEIIEELNESVAGWREYYKTGDIREQFEHIEGFLFDQLSLLLMKKQGKGEFKKLEDMRIALKDMEFLLSRMQSEKQKFVELLIAQSRGKRGKAKETLSHLPTQIPSPASSPQKTLSMQEVNVGVISSADSAQPTTRTIYESPLQAAQPVEKQIAVKRRKYEKVLAKDNDLIVSTPGIFLGKTKHRVVVRQKGKKANEIPFFMLKSIVIVSEYSSLSTALIKHCSTQGITINFLGFDGRPYAQIYSSTAPLFGLSLAQIKAATNGKGIHLAKCFITGKIKNQINLLKYYGKYKRRRSSEFAGKVDGSIKNMESLLKKLGEITRAKNGNYEKMRLQLFALEGHSASYYWGLIKTLLSNDVYFEGRERRGATDLVNSLLNYGYGMLYSKVHEAVALAGLNPNISFLHKERVGRPTLVFDLIEEFRQPVVDRVVIGMIRKKEKLTMNKTNLSEETKVKLIENVFERLNTKVNFRGSKVSLRDVVKHQAKSVANYIEGKGNYRPFVEKW